MRNPENPMQEALDQEKRELSLDARLAEFEESDSFRMKDEQFDLNSLDVEQYGHPDPVPSEALSEDMPKFMYSESQPDFWSLFLNYVISTRRRPDTKENLASKFYSDRKIRKSLVSMQSRGENISNILDKCIREINGKFVLVDEEGRYALMRQSQLPSNVPSGDTYDMPLDAYLRQKEWEPAKARRTHTMFAGHVKETDPSFLIRSESYGQEVVKGYRKGILTVGSFVAFQQKYPVEHIFGLADTITDSVLGTLKANPKINI